MDSIMTLIPPHVVNALGWTLIHTLWQAGLIAFVLFAATWLARNQKAQVKYALSVFAFSAISIWAASTFYFLVSHPEINTAGIGELRKKGQLLVADNLQGVVSSSFGKNNFQELLLVFEQQMPQIVLIWLIGAILFAVRLLGGFYLLERMKRRAVVVEDCWNKLLVDIKSKLNISRKVLLNYSTDVASPAVMGLVRPVVLVPIGFFSGLTSKQVEAVLAHELAHIKRHDFAVNLVQSVMEVILFFNPFVWWISYEIKRERENCCDDIAVSVSKDSKEYAEALLHLGGRPNLAGDVALGILGGKHHLKSRVRRLFGEATNHSGTPKFIVAGFFVVLTSSFYFYSDSRKIPTGDLRELSNLNSGIFLPGVRQPKALPTLRIPMKEFEEKSNILDTPRVTTASELRKAIKEIELRERKERLSTLQKINYMHLEMLELQFKEVKRLRVGLSLEELQAELQAIAALQENFNITNSVLVENDENALQTLEEMQMVFRQRLMELEEAVKNRLDEKRMKTDNAIKAGKLSAARMESKMALLEEKLRKMLHKDGYIANEDAEFTFQFREDLRVDGKRIKKKHYQKYQDLSKILIIAAPLRFEKRSRN